MLDQLKNIKVYHALFVAFVVCIISAFSLDTELRTDNQVATFINLGIVLFILSGITYRFKNLLSEYKNYKSDEKIHLSLMVIFTLLVFYFFNDKMTWGDDNAFKTVLGTNTLHKYLADRYCEWSSRCIIEAVLISLVKSNIYLWRILSSILVTISVECVISLFLSEKNIKYSFVAYLLTLLTIPSIVLTDAGWIATTTNYLWPLAAFLSLMVVLKKIFNNEKIDGYEKAQAIVLTLFATNIEPLSLCIVGFSVLLFAFRVYDTKISVKELANKIDKTYFIIVGLSIVLLVVILLAPGNTNRTIVETSVWYPEFADFSLIDKLKLGIVATLPFFYANTIYICNNIYPTNFLMLLLLLFTCIKLWKDKQTKILIFQALAIIVVLWNQIHIIAQTFDKQLTPHWYILANTKIGQQSDFESIYIYLEIVIYVFLLGTLLYGVFYALNKGKNALLACVILLAGFCARFIMGFSPTVYASGTRTFLFTIVAVLVVTVMMINELLNEEKNKKIVLTSFLVTIVYVFLLMPKTSFGTEFQFKTEIVDISEIKDYPVHANKDIRKAFRIDANNNKYQPEDEDILDFDREKGMFLTGWAYDIETKEALSGMYIVMGDKCIKVNYGSNRKDVANAFNVSKKVGFSIILPKDLFIKNNGMVDNMDFYLIGSSNKSRYRHFTFKVRYPNLEEKKLANENWELGLHIESCNEKLQKEEDHNLLFDKEKGIVLGGWAIDFANKTRLGGIQVSIGDTTIYADYGNKRQDVADFFKMNDNGLGFKIEIPAEVLNKRKDVSDIGFVLISPNLDFKYEPIIYKIKR